MRIPITKPLLRRALLKLYQRERRIVFSLLAKVDAGDKYLNRPFVLNRYFVATTAYRAAIEQMQIEMDIEGERLLMSRRARRRKHLVT